MSRTHLQTSLDTTLPDFQREVRWNQAYCRLAQGL